MSDDADCSANRYDLPAIQVDRLEQLLLQHPEDIETRYKLLEHYFVPALYTEEAFRRRLQHIIWVVQHHPDSELAGSSYAHLHEGSDVEAISAVTQVWKQQVALYPNSAQVLGNAAKFLIHASSDDESLVGELLRAADQLDPSKPEWPERLGRLDEFERRQLEGRAAVDAARQALIHYERAFALTVDEGHKILLLDNLAVNAFASEEFNKATEYATKLLNGASLCKDGVQAWNYGNALHRSHIVLGKLALQQDNVDVAKQHLLEAGDTPGSPQLNSYGPDMSLAKLLLECGEKEAVLAYFSACSNFWACGKVQLDEWVSDILQDRTPDFDDFQFG